MQQGTQYTFLAVQKKKYYNLQNTGDRYFRLSLGSNFRKVSRCENTEYIETNDNQLKRRLKYESFRFCVKFLMLYYGALEVWVTCP